MLALDCTVPWGSAALACFQGPPSFLPAAVTPLLAAPSCAAQSSSTQAPVRGRRLTCSLPQRPSADALPLGAVDWLAATS